jgi:hypothetical protein
MVMAARSQDQHIKAIRVKPVEIEKTPLPTNLTMPPTESYDFDKMRS